MLSTLNAHPCADPNIEVNTRGQSSNPQWYHERKLRLTASRFYEILHTRDVEKFCMQMIARNKHPIPSVRLSACQFGLDSEPVAMDLYVRRNAGRVGFYYQPGVCVSLLYPPLAATPDFIVYADPLAKPILPNNSDGAWLVEIKSFVTNPNARDIMDLARIRTDFFFKPNDDGHTITINKEHKFYYQIMGQLNMVFGPDPNARCDVVLFYSGDIFVLTLKNDIKFWSKRCDNLMKLGKYYIDLAETH